jgi:steroid delta-isomerase-like uncharacterized protein
MDHTDTMRRMYRLISSGDVDGFVDLLAPDFVEHEELPGAEDDREAVRRFFHAQVAAFPDLVMTPEDVIDGGERVVARVRLTGTHRGPFMGLEPTGRTVDVPLIDIMRFGDDGLAHEHWGVFDALGMLRQLGVVH